MEPVISNKEITEDGAKAAGLPVIDGKQTIATARHGRTAWYAFTDGSTTIRDDNGNPAEWPA